MAAINHSPSYICVVGCFGKRICDRPNVPSLLERYTQAAKHQIIPTF